MNLMPCQAP